MARRPRTIGPTAEDPTFGPQHVLDLVRSTVPPVHPAGRPFIAAGLAVAFAGRHHRWLRRAGLLAAGACAGFFRHPPRVPPTRPGAIVAPADGVVCVIDSAAPPAELGMAETPLTRVSIFLSLLDAHVQRAPVSGEVTEVNPDLAEHPEKLNTDPHTAAWLVKIKLNDPSEVQNLMNAADYQSYVGAEK